MVKNINQQQYSCGECGLEILGSDVDKIPLGCFLSNGEFVN